MHMAAAQSPQAEGAAAGRAANTAARATISATSAAQVVPGYTASPPEASLAGRVNLAADADARLAACALTPNDPGCQAVLTARRSAATPRPLVSPDDPAVVGARAAAANHAAAGVPLSGVYSGCRTRSVAVSGASFDRQSCYQYLKHTLDQPCRKDLVVSVAWQCPSGASAGPSRGINPGTGSATWTCTMPRPREEAFCTAQLTGPTLATTGAEAGRLVCTSADGVISRAPMRTVIDQVTLPASPLIIDQWANGCAGHEARVPTGWLPPDGVDAPTFVGQAMQGVVNRCERQRSVCTEPAQTRVINDLAVTRACWQFDNRFDCLDADSRSDCHQPRFGACSATGAPACIDWDATSTPPLCTAYRHDFDCQQTAPVTQTIEDCGAQTFCAGGLCPDVSYPPDEDFARTVAMLEASREAGRYLDPATLRVFKGFDNRCRKKLFGLVNCCNRGGTAARSQFSNLAIAAQAAGTIGKAAVSSYTYDALFVSDAPAFILSGFEALWGSGFSSGLAGVLAGDLSVSSFMGSLVPGWWSLAILAIQMSGILSCPDAEQVTAMKRDANLCVALGEYCSRRLPIIRTCVESTQSYCCFNSRLARIINQQGLAQVGRGMGSASAPNCSGFSVDELQALDFARMDLTEFYAEIVPTLPQAAGLTGAAAAKVPACYHGAGRC